MTHDDLFRAVSALKRYFPNKQIDITQTTEDWYGFFKDVDRNDFALAVGEWINKSVYFPMVADLKDIINRKKLLSEPLVLNSDHMPLFEDSGCMVCPYLMEGQCEPCESCMFEGGSINEDTGN